MPADHPIQNYHFQVDWGGSKIGFSKVRNLGMGIYYHEYRHGASPEYQVSKIPTRPYFDDIILERGVFQGDNEFYEWWKETNFFSANNYKRDLTISILNDQHEPIVIWKVKNAFPNRLRMSDLDAQSNGIAIELLELTHEGLVLMND